MKRFLMIVLACTIFLKGLAQAQYMIVTTKNGHKTAYNVDDIESVWLSDETEKEDIGQKLKILAVGNSFTEDGTWYLPQILAAAGIPKKRLLMYRIVAGGSSLEYWDKSLSKKATGKTYKIYGDETPLEEDGNYTLDDVLSFGWDVVVFHQVSSQYHSISSYEPYITNLFSAAKRAGKGDTKIAWQMVWSRSNDSKDQYITGTEGWRNYVYATKELMQNHKIDILIPTGTTIQNARNTEFCPEGDFTRDTQHIAYGAGRYLAAMTWYGTLIAPYFNRNIYDLNYKYTTAEWEKRLSNYESLDIEETNISTLIDCIGKAIVSPYSLGVR